MSDSNIAPPSMTPVEAAWLAGLMEGEGWFCIYFRDRGSGLHVNFVIGIDMTDADVLHKAQRLSKAGKVGANAKLREGCKPIYKWSIGTRSEVLRVCREIYPHMGFRRRQKILELFAYGQSPAQISCRLDRKTSGRPRETNYVQIKKLRREGLSMRDIASRIGVSVGTVHRAVHLDELQRKEGVLR